MKPVSMLFAGLLFAATPAVEARSIDCAKAADPLEREICADPVMLDYDDRIAAAYGRALAIWDGAIAAYVRRDQRTWLTGFRTMALETAIEGDCVLTDRECIRDQLRRRVDDVESGAYVHSGVYRSAGGMKLLLHPGNADGYTVRLYDPARAAKVNILSADADRSALWDGPQALVSTMGDADGLPLPSGDGCTLRLSPQPLAIRVAQTGSCRGQSFDGVYTRLLDETLQSYELELR